MARRVLVVEDSPTQAERVRLLLEADGYAVELARDGREGFTRVKSAPPDLIISDVVMPEMDGYAFCSAVKSAEATRRIPFVLFTERKTAADIITGLEAGADNFIPKASEDDYLLARVRSIFEHLEHRGKGDFDMEFILSVGGRKITINADKHQIVELLFATFDELQQVNGQLEEARRILEAYARDLEREVADRRQAEESARLASTEADRANRAKSEFLSRMSHELRTPLNAILGFAQLLQMEVQTPEQRESVAHILKAGRHLMDLIDEVLDIARIEAGRLHLSPEPVPVADLLRETLDLMRPLAAQRAIRLETGALPGEDGHVRADRQRLKQVLLNLLSNAIKYNRDAGRVTLTCAQAPGDRLHIRVTDTGPGIPAALMARLFTPFDRLGAEQQGVEGTGLGLVLSKRLVEAMGGAMGCESALGEGSTFWVELPLAAAPAERLKELPPEVLAAAPAPGPAATVLYIEDNLSNLRLVERVLAHRPGIRVLPAMQGRLGLDLAREHRPALIFLDLQLPDLPGYEVLRHLQGDPRTREIPVLVISADASPGQIQRTLAAGARAYLTKPLDVRGLLAAVDEHLTPPAGGRGA